MNVLLFDIDGTLINSNGAGMAALRDAMAEEFQVPWAEEVPLQGRTDRGIAGNLFKAHDIDNSQENWERFRAAYLNHLPASLPKKQGRVLPGVVELLDRLGSQAEVVSGLLTGNTSDGARMKLEYFQLYEHFAFGGYGDLHPLRDDVAREALTAAEEHVGRSIDPQRVWVIGDTTLDIQCARAIGARVAAVATGFDSAEDLSAAGPDLLLEDLSDPDEFLAMLAGSSPAA